MANTLLTPVPDSELADRFEDTEFFLADDDLPEASPLPPPDPLHSNNPLARMIEPYVPFNCWLDQGVTKRTPNGMFLPESGHHILNRRALELAGGCDLPNLKELCAACAGTKLAFACNLEVIRLSKPVHDRKGKFESVGVIRFNDDPEEKMAAISEFQFGEPEP